MCDLQAANQDAVSELLSFTGDRHVTTRVYFSENRNLRNICIMHKKESLQLKISSFISAGVPQRQTDSQKEERGKEGEGKRTSTDCHGDVCTPAVR